MATHQLKSTLPSHKPPTFAGDVMEYPAFIMAFDAFVESKVSEPIELLYYLEQYTTAKAKEVIKGCLQSKTESSSKNTSEKTFGDSFRIANAYVTKLSSWTPIKPNEREKFQEFAIVLEQASKHSHDRNGLHR
ncbi:Hypothetical predicted protein [Paramuricea clavata]|uniref:Uncharacterized protein n=1 Tax=Paramuricea clavata TaxID=317549 RepID=A0A7D9L3I5_PARCT|nr:Hypothetical predicted protein [Paramuricea clavata]